MPDSNDGNWITVNGSHIFVKDGETDEQAIERSFSSDRDKLAATLERRSAFNNRQYSKSSSRITLSKQEWAMFYERIGKIKKEGHYVPKTASGKMIIPIETKDSNVLVIASGTYEKPNAEYEMRCKSSDHMYEIIARIEKI